MNALKIQVTIKTVYGVEQCYPACAAAKAFARIAGTTTLTRQTLTEVARLGYAIEVVKVGSFGVSILYRCNERLEPQMNLPVASW